jgi:ATP-dependent Lhr-like helicase
MSFSPGLLEWLPTTASSEAALACLPAPVSRWFLGRFGQPTEIQRLAWPPLAAGKNVLLSAPTGTGKTLAALLPLIASLYQSRSTGSPWSIATGITGIYLSPLRALANDTERNLTEFLSELAGFWPPETPTPRLLLRTGDATAEERKRLCTDPPDLLLTTPESLAVLLSQPRLLPHFASLRWVVIDELHALVGNKRGADLSLSLERLERLADSPLQRVGMSATVTPLEDSAHFLAGAGRACAIASLADTSGLEIAITPMAGRGRFVAELVERIAPLLPKQRSTLIFTNTRSLAERLAWSLRRRLPEWDQRIAVHHSALAADRRHEVETQFKAGQLRAVVSSTSLELGIDIGPIDLVVLVHPPGDVVRLLQRLGRSGHGPGRVRRGLVLTASAAELLEAAVTVRSSRPAQCEPLRPIEQPLDVLCQQVLGLASAGWSPGFSRFEVGRPAKAGTPTCSADEVFTLVRRAYPYRDLTRQDFDDCLRYLLGLDQAGQSWLPARVRGSLEQFTVCNQRTARLLRRNLGSILTEEPLGVYVCQTPQEENATEDDPPRLIGQVDLRFAERLQPGDRFLLDGRCLEVSRQDPDGLLVQETVGRPAVPRWGGDGWPLSAPLAQRLFLLRVQAAEALRDGPTALANWLQQDLGLDPAGAGLLAAYFQEQEQVSEIPDAGVCLIEVVVREGGTEYYLHTPLNRLACDALTRVLVHRLARDLGRTVLPIVADLGLALLVRGSPLAEGPALAELFRTLLDVRDFATDLNSCLAASDLLRQRFQRVAVTGLMLLRNPLGRKRRVGGPDWAERRLFEQVQAHDPDFVLLRQAAREVRGDCCDCTAALDYAARLPELAIRCRWLPRVSPFASNWTQSEVGEPELTEGPAEVLQRLHASLLGMNEGLGDAVP